MIENLDWYPPSRAGERLMFGNIEAKIDGYAGKYPILTVDHLLEKVHTACQTYIEGFDKIEYNRATARQATAWFKNLMESKEDKPSAAAPPVFMAITLPAGAFGAIERFMREFRALLVSQLNYDKADGLDLMLEREKPDDLNLTEFTADVKFSSNETTIRGEWKKLGFDMLEAQWRRAGTTVWQPGDKTTERVVEFEVPLTTPGVPEKFEFRAICLIKNQRVGNWSPIYTLTVG